MRHVGTNTFETERLVCRPFREGDCGDMFKNWASDPNIQREYGEPVYGTARQTAELLKKYIEGYKNPDFYRWAIVEKSSGENIGQIAFCKVWSDCGTAEVEYCIGGRFQGRGYAGEALRGLISHAFESTDFQSLKPITEPKTPNRGGFLKSPPCASRTRWNAFLRENVSPHNEVCYCITRDMYKTK